MIKLTQKITYPLNPAFNARDRKNDMIEVEEGQHYCIVAFLG